MPYVSVESKELISEQKNGLIIRNGSREDYAAVESLTREAFWNVYCPGACEHFMLHVMRDRPAFVPEVGLVAGLDRMIIGIMVFVSSHIDMDNDEKLTVLSPGPIAVAPEYQPSTYSFPTTTPPIE